MRLFIALPLPSPVIDAVAQAQSSLKRELSSPALRWTKPENTHLTLLFLGDVDENKLPELTQQFRDACETIAPFELKLAGTGCFPNARRPRVLWLGLGGELDALQNLQARISNHCAPFCEKSDDKPFRPHLTLARVKPDARSTLRGVDETLAALPLNNVAWRVESVELMQSKLLPSGAEYSCVESVPITTRLTTHGLDS